MQLNTLHNKSVFPGNTFLFFYLLLIFVTPLHAQLQHPKHEMRGVWIATVANIDYPSSRSLSSGQKIAELTSAIRKMQAAGINTVFFQIRTECDALYNSSVEPWSYWLTGVQGQKPEPYFDPLEFAVKECHEAGIELHVWLNPYRAVKTINGYPAASNHVSVLHPDWLLSFKDYQMLDPGKPEVMNYIISVVNDVVSRYDIDGVHFDDYFYPYGPKIAGEDSLTFVNNSRGFTNIDDWRRDNINSLMHRINLEIKKQKPYVRFGISPFGIVENKYAGTDGFESYKILYCDPLTWIKNGTVDYILPQLYWEMNHPKAAFSKLLPWWASISKPVDLYIGLYASNFLKTGYKDNQAEIGDQIRMCRATKNTGGVVFFSALPLLKNMKNFTDSLTYQFFLYPALPLPSPCKDSALPRPPESIQLKMTERQVSLTWQPARGSELINRYVVYRYYAGEEISLEDSRAIKAIVPASNLAFSEYIGNYARDYVYYITAVDRYGRESKASVPVKLELK